MEWYFKKFSELNANELYKILKERYEVFAVEQNCHCVDIDGKDTQSIHIFAEENGEIAAYCRIVPKGLRFDEISLGRILTTSNYRGIGIGKELLKRSIEYVTQVLGENEIKIFGQAYLRKFYESFGFNVTTEEIFYEDEIPHFEMYFKLNS